MLLNEYLLARGFPARLVCNGQFQRFDHRGGSLNGWFIGRQYKVGEKEVAIARFGDWRTQEEHRWRSLDNEDSLTPEERTNLTRAMAEAEAEERAAKELQHKRTADEAASIWEDAITRGSSPYLERKGLGHELFGCRLDPREPSTLLVPVYGVGGLSSLQAITPSGEKRFLPGGKLKGCFHLIGELKQNEPDIFYICEGIATAASIHLATGARTACAFNAGNLRAVAALFRKQFPAAQIVLCGDDDTRTTRPDGSAYNPGREAAEAAAREVGGIAVFPRFANGGSGSDWNDLHVGVGLDEVRLQIEYGLKDRGPADEEPSAQAGKSDETHYDGIKKEPGFGVVPLGFRMVKGKELAPLQQMYANALLKHYGPRLIKQHKDIFQYVGTHWKILDTFEYDYIKQQIQALGSGALTFTQVESIFRLFVTGIDHVPEGVNLFIPPPLTANFQNGTLLVTKQGRTYSTYFKAHEPGDWVVNVLPYRYGEGCQERNGEFDLMLERVFEGDADRLEKIRAVGQMYGACLIATFPHLFMLWGPPGTGKSTVIKLAARLVHQNNACSVDPTDFGEFNMETMAGKLLNFDTDIEMHRPISEKHIKKIDDRLPFRIRRKNKTDVYAPIPATHVFGGNSIPKTLDGVSKAHDRRWTFLEFSKVVAKGDYDVDYADFVFQQSPQGILNFALKGLADLLASGGHFFVPASGKEKMAEWQLQTDPVGQFLDDCKREQVVVGNSRLKPDLGGRVSQKQVWSCFSEWHLDTYRRPASTSRIKFYRLLRDAGYPTVALGGFDHFVGLALEVVVGATH